MPSLLDEDRLTEENTGQHDRLSDLSGDEYRRSNELLASLDDDPRGTVQRGEAVPADETAPEKANLMNYAPAEAAPASTTGNTSGFRRFFGNRKALIGLGLGGGTTAILIVMSMLMPLKFEALISNASKAAAAIPGYAVEERTEYILTRVLATRILQLSYDLKDEDIEPVFCKTRGAIGCSLLATYSAKYISESMGLDMVKVGDNVVKVSINEKGRQSLGGYARSWDIELTRDWGDSGVLKTMKKIQSHSEMRTYLKNKVEKQYKNTITRFVARRILMMKYGVRSWRAFEKTQEKIDNKIADVKTQFKVGMYKNTIGKISPRFAAYIACLQGGTLSCEETLKSLNDSLKDPGKAPKRSDYDSEAKFLKAQDEYDRAKKQYDALAKVSAKIRGEIPETPTGNMLTSSLQKIFSTKVIATASGVLSVVMITDTVMSAVNMVDNGTLDEIGFDMASQVYTGFAFGDSTGIVTNWEKTKVGDQADEVGSEVMNEIGTLVDCDGSSLCAYENGYPGTVATASLSSTASAASASFVRECETSEGIKAVTLEPGELVCPERKLVRNYAELFTSNPSFQMLGEISKVWVSSIGWIINEAGKVAEAATGWFMEPIKAAFKPLGDAIMQQVEPLIAWFMDSIFNPPSVGYDTTPANNYDAVSGALHIEEWELMKNGVTDGQTLGGGGQYLTEEESQDVLAYQRTEDASDFAEQSLFARLFDTSLKGSLAQQLVLQMPNSAAEVALLPSTALSLLMNTSSATAASSTTVTSSPFGLPNYGYTVGDPVLTADPKVYTEESCAASAAAREASLTNKLNGKRTVVPVYTKSDPCALEKLVVGSLITAANPTDEYAFQSIGSTTITRSGQCAANTQSLGVYDNAHDDGKKVSVELCELSSIKLQAGFYTEQDPAIFRSGSGGVIVGASVSDDFQKLGEAALAEKPSRQLVGKGIRSYEKQEYFYNCYLTKKCNNGNLAAEPGTSNHENGTAIDFVLGSGDLAWLRANGGTFGLKELTQGTQPEPWHWSPVGN